MANNEKIEHQKAKRNGFRIHFITEENWEDAAAERLITIPGSAIMDDPCAEIVIDDKTFRFSTFGNFSLIIGKPKSRKTTLVTLIIAEALKQQ